ncbi:hypothetical protein DAPPUDRAFT_242340 [Daphnia pulex]|uniref:Uncharacterized protein n=1 Tax=Daphnia pulex TaxID=6669 RepID=E9GGF0_DAPPU|nr:hypothetical protein DAPPUDRAFT_242340 [Daphnia pulex]|eukprot:EFX81511.1 hypothetical protein DAPPUDRAFT_242340 [Daphnia pulex]
MWTYPKSNQTTRASAPSELGGPFFLLSRLLTMRDPFVRMPTSPAIPPRHQGGQDKAVGMVDLHTSYLSAGQGLNWRRDNFERRAGHQFVVPKSTGNSGAELEAIEMSRLEHNWQSENSGASDGRPDSSESERLEQVARSLSPSSPLLRSAASEGDNDGSERVRSRRSRNSWTTVQARRAVDNHQRLRSVPDVHQSSGRPWTHQPGGQDESPSSLLPGASSAYQSREQQPWEQHQQRRSKGQTIGENAAMLN